MSTVQFPFYEETTILFHALNTFQFEKLDEMIDQEASTVMNSHDTTAIHSSREEWSQFLKEQYALMKESTGKTDIKISEYRGEQTNETGWSTVKFNRTIELGDDTERKYYVATILWKITPKGAKVMRLHVSPDHVEYDSAHRSDKERRMIYPF
ncbi:MAG: hypothetical protein V4642_12505 [Bacteroidota bacterium]